MADERVALYARVSTEQQARDNTIASQIAALRERIAADGRQLEGSVSARASEYRCPKLKPVGGQAASKIPSTATVLRRRSSLRRSAGTCW